MATAACGINCDVCRLRLVGICTTCGPGKSPEAQQKLAVQKQLMGAPCPILSCATEKGVGFCLMDCEEFPCEPFKSGPYPFSRGFLSMQERRRNEKRAVKEASGSKHTVPVEYWETLEGKDIDHLCETARVRRHSKSSVILSFLNERLRIDSSEKHVYRSVKDRWKPVDYPLLELIALVYLLKVKPGSIANDMVSVQELKTAHFFRGPHELRILPLIERYGLDMNGFIQAAEKIGGDRLTLADAAFAFTAFPKIPVYYLYWEGDQEFQTSISVLFDRSIEQHLPADAIWGLVNLVTDSLLFGGVFI